MHGYLSSGKSFYNQLNFFSRDFEVYAPDLKGFGDNASMSYPYALDDYVEEVREYMYKNSIVKPHAVGHSFGGRIVLKGAAGDGELFDKLVLVGAAGLKPRASLKKSVKKIGFNILKKFLPREKLTGFYSPDYLALDGVMRESFRLIVGERLEGAAERIINNTLIVFGERDKETPVYMAKRLNKKIKNSRLIILKDAGHFCFIDRPLKFNTEVKEFLLS